MAAFSVKRRSRYAHSKNFYRDLANFSTAVAHKSKPRRKILFSGEYFDVERLIATRETKDGVSLLFSAEVTLIGADEDFSRASVCLVLSLCLTNGLSCLL